MCWASKIADEMEKNKATIDGKTGLRAGIYIHADALNLDPSQVDEQVNVELEKDGAQYKKVAAISRKVVMQRWTNSSPSRIIRKKVLKKLRKHTVQRMAIQKKSPFNQGKTTAKSEKKLKMWGHLYLKSLKTLVATNQLWAYFFYKFSQALSIHIK